MGKMVRAGAGAGIFDKLEPEPELEPDKNGPAPQHCLNMHEIAIITCKSHLAWKGDLVSFLALVEMLVKFYPVLTDQLLLALQ
jgi:hypothetical protein